MAVGILERVLTVGATMFAYRITVPLTCSLNPATFSSSLQIQRCEVDSSDTQGGHRHCAVFLCPQHGKAFMGGPCGRPSGLPVTCGRSVNLHGSLTRLTAGSGIQTATQGATNMPKPPILTLNPFKNRAARYRAQALTALYADSSLSVRLKRYNAAMAKARELEAQGGAV